MSFTYTYSISNDTVSGTVASSKLHNEIVEATLNGSINKAFNGVLINNNDLNLNFLDEISSSSLNVLDEIVYNHNGIPLINNNFQQVQIVGQNNKIPTLSSLGNQKVEIVPSEGEKYNLISINWADKTTWYQDSKPITETLSNSGDNQTFSGSHDYWIDVSHGKLTGEDLISNYKPIITIGTSSYTENSPSKQNNDYTIDYDKGHVIFNVPLLEGTVPTASYYYEDGSNFSVEPPEGKILKITYIEAQFSKDIELEDDVIFQAYGDVEKFAPHLSPTPYPTGTKIPIGKSVVYKTFSDYINESNGSNPIIPKIGGNNWRALKEDVIIFKWDYIAATELKYSKGMQVKTFLKNNIPFSGSYAVATFYCLLFDEE